MSFLMDFRNEVLARSRCAIDDRVDRLNRYYAIVFIIACVFFLSTKNIVGKQIFCFTPERFTLTQVRLSLRKWHNDEMCGFGMSFTIFDSIMVKGLAIVSYRRSTLTITAGLKVLTTAWRIQTRGRNGTKPGIITENWKWTNIRSSKKRRKCCCSIPYDSRKTRHPGETAHPCRLVHIECARAKTSRMC